MSLGKSILKHQKKLIYTILAFILGQICFFNLGGIGLENNVYAVDGDTTTQSNSSQEWASKVGENMGTIQKIIYVFIFPLLVVAGKLVDNSFVYGEIFGFDAVLWKLWNITKNLANFGLGFLLIYNIFSNLLSKKGDMKKLLINTLIAGIGIQASWFVMAALLDISTILTYSVGGLPISVLKNKIENSQGDENLKYNPYVLKNVIFFDVNNGKVDKYLTNAGTYADSSVFYISECKTFSVQDRDNIKSVELLLAPSMIYYQNESKDKKVQIRQTESNACHYYNQVYYFKELYTGNTRGNCVDTGSCAESQREYNSVLNSATTDIKNKSSEEVSQLIDQAKLLEIGNAHVEGGIVGKLGTVLYTGDLAEYGVDLYNERTGTGKTKRLDSILDESSYVGVFTALYTSLINSIGFIPPDAGLYASLLNVALSVGHMIAIGIPLIVVAIVFMIRIGILWAAIVISPFIILLTAFGLGNKIFTENLEYFQPSKLLMVIFSPVIICFAISISTVLVTILSGMNVDAIESVKSEILGGLIKLDIGGFTISIGKLIVSLLGIAITRFLVWASVEYIFKSGTVNKMITNLKGLASTAIGSIPIVPIIGKDEQGNPTAKFIGANSAFGLNERQGIFSSIMDKTTSKYSSEETKLLEDIVNHDRVRERQADAYKTEIVKIDPTSDWTKQNIKIKGNSGNFIDFNFDSIIPSKKKDIIDAINAISDVNKRKAFGTTAPDVSFNDGENRLKYKFVNDKYEKQDN